MSSHDDLLQQGIAAVRAGQLEQGRQLLAKAIQLNPQSETAWIWMSGVVQTDEQRISCLQQVIAINPNNELAIKGLQALGAMGAPSATPPPTAAETPPGMDMGMSAEPTPFGMASAPMDSGSSFEEIGSLELPPAPADSSADLLGMPPDATPPEPIRYDFGQEQAAPGVPPPPPPPPPRVVGPPPPAPDGVPLIDGMQITQAQREVEGILRELRDRSLVQFPHINWAPPESLQTRERSLLSAFSPLAVVGVGGGVIVILVILISSIMIGIISGRTPLGIAGGTGGGTGPIISTLPPTPLSTRTPTPAGTQFDPGPTIDAGAAPHGLPSFGKLTATPLYVSTPHPESPPLRDAQLAFGREDWITTLDGIQRARDVGVDSIDAYYMEGIALAKLGQEDRAIEAFNNGLDQNAEFAPFHAGLGYVYHLQGNAERARDNSEKAIQLDPKLIMPYVTLAKLDVEEGEYNDALAVIKAGKENLGGYDVNLIVAEGEVYLAQENFEKAAELGNYAYYIDPTVEGPVLLVARARLGLELPDAAIITLQDYLDNYNPSSAEGWALLSKSYSAVGRRADALTANSRALQLSGNAVDALVTRGKLYLDQGKYELACEDLNAAVENDDTNYEARLGRAKCSYYLGDSETAVEDIEYIRSVSSGSSELDMLYVQALVAEERWNDAITAASNAYNRGRLTQAQYGNVLEAQGYAFYQVGDYNNAFLNMEAAIKVEQTGTRHYYRGLIYEALGDYQRATWSYEWVLYWNSIYNYPFAEDAEERLAKVSGQAAVTPTASPTPSPTPTTTPTPAASPSATPTPTAQPTTPGGTPTKTPTRAPTRTPTPGKTGTPKGTSTPKPTGTP